MSTLASTSRGPAATPWLIVAAGFLALAVSFSARSALSLTMATWQTELGWPRGFVSSVAAGAMLVMACLAPLAGTAVDRLGPRWLLVGGLTFIGAGLALIASVPPAAPHWVLVLGYGLLGAVGFGVVAQHVIATTVATRFDKNLGLATGIATSGSTGGLVLVMPLLALLLQAGQWRQGFFALAAVALVLVPIMFLATKSAPAHESHHGPAARMPLSQQLLTLVKSPAYHALFWSYSLCGFTTSGTVETHLIPYASFCGFPPLPSATAFSILSGVNLLGMIGAGWLSDRVNRPRLLAGIYVARAACFALLLFVEKDYTLLVAFAILFGIFDYSTVPVTAGLLASRMGLGSLGLAMGVLSAGHALGGAAGALAGGLVFDWTGQYAALWYGCIGLALAAAVMVIGLSDERPGERVA